jgi:hypothetical protein
MSSFSTGFANAQDAQHSQPVRRSARRGDVAVNLGALAFVAVLGSVLGACADSERALTNAAATPAAAQTDQAGRFPALDDAAAWERIPRATPSLPIWARTLIDALPRTTALQLDLDALHRTHNPLGPALATRVRWAVAEANRCAYARQSAEADWTRAGFESGDLPAYETLPEPERLALDFARDLTLAAAAIPDAQVARLIEALGVDDAVALVHTIAHANFQQRLFLALGLEREPGEPVPAREARPTAAASYSVPERAPVAPPSPAAANAPREASRWSAHSYADVRALLESQKERIPRIPPADEARLARLPKPDRARVAGSAWGKVSMGYQPELTRAWFQTMRAFGQEAQLDEVLENSMFWVITRTSDCFY